ncbi:hypothetical protein QTN25_006285 [Entamoeba marina]
MTNLELVYLMKVALHFETFQNVTTFILTCHKGHECIKALKMNPWFKFANDIIKFHKHFVVDTINCNEFSITTTSILNNVIYIRNVNGLSDYDEFLASLPHGSPINCPFPTNIQTYMDSLKTIKTSHPTKHSSLLPKLTNLNLNLPENSRLLKSIHRCTNLKSITGSLPIIHSVYTSLLNHSLRPNLRKITITQLPVFRTTHNSTKTDPTNPCLNDLLEYFENTLIVVHLPTPPSTSSTLPHHPNLRYYCSVLETEISKVFYPAISNGSVLFHIQNMPNDIFKNSYLNSTAPCELVAFTPNNEYAKSTDIVNWHSSNLSTITITSADKLNFSASSNLRQLYLVKCRTLHCTLPTLDLLSISCSDGHIDIPSIHHLIVNESNKLKITTKQIEQLELHATSPEIFTEPIIVQNVTISSLIYPPKEFLNTLISVEKLIIISSQDIVLTNRQKLLSIQHIHFIHTNRVHLFVDAPKCSFLQLDFCDDCILSFCGSISSQIFAYFCKNLQFVDVITPEKLHLIYSQIQVDVNTTYLTDFTTISTSTSLINTEPVITPSSYTNLLKTPSPIVINCLPSTINIPYISTIIKKVDSTTGCIVTPNEILNVRGDLQHNGSTALCMTTKPFSSDQPFIFKFNNEYLVVESSAVYYYEVELLPTPPTRLDVSEHVISIGFVQNPNYPSKNEIGWREHSIGYHSDDGKLFYHTGFGPNFGRPFGDNDIIGCGFIPHKHAVFFTLNGKKVRDYIHVEEDLFYPAVGMRSVYAARFNFGERPFKFDLLQETLQIGDIEKWFDCRGNQRYAPTLPKRPQKLPTSCAKDFLLEVSNKSKILSEAKEKSTWKRPSREEDYDSYDSYDDSYDDYYDDFMD